jgi:hypothetical protein
LEESVPSEKHRIRIWLGTRESLYVSLCGPANAEAWPGPIPRTSLQLGLEHLQVQNTPKNNVALLDEEERKNNTTMKKKRTETNGGGEKIRKTGRKLKPVMP